MPALADDVRMIQSTYPLRAGAADVGMFFGIYARSAPERLAPAWPDGREVIAGWEDPQAVKPSYLMWLDWTDGRISFIRDCRYIRYVVDDAELVLAPDTAPPGEGTADECALGRRHRRRAGATRPRSPPAIKPNRKSQTEIGGGARRRLARAWKTP